MMWNWGAARTRAYLICSGATLAAALILAPVARAEDCRPLIAVEQKSALSELLESCLIDLRVYREMTDDCRVYGNFNWKAWRDCAETAPAKARPFWSDLVSWHDEGMDRMAASYRILVEKKP